jgi:uncharacterized protein involved in response to NO
MPTPFSQKEISAEIPLPLWQITFRPFFLAASLFITFALAVWTLILSQA